jgi:hypothetical protein
VAAVTLVVFLMLAINSYLAAHTLGIFKISHGKLGPTEIRLVLIIGNLFLLHGAHARIFGHRFLLFDIGGVVSIIIMGSMLVFSSIKNTHTLYDLERLPKARDQRSEVGGQRSEVRNQRSEVREQLLESLPIGPVSSER